MTDQTIIKEKENDDGKLQEYKDQSSLHTWLVENMGIMVKLATFSAALFALPILTFFGTLHSLFEGNTTYAGGAAALMANVILFLYIITAWLEKPKEIGGDKKKD